MSAPYPLKIKATAKAVAEFRDSECGSWEDSGGTGESLDEDTGSLHVYNILARHKTVIEIRSDAEARAVYLAACSGTWQTRPERVNGEHVGDGRGYYHAACKVCDIIRMHAPDCLTAGDLERWPAPSGL